MPDSTRDLYVSGNSAKKVRGNSAKTEHWNRLPDSVLLDHDLSLAARCVYAFLAGSTHQGTITKVGQTLIARKLGIHGETVRLALRELKERKHLTIIGAGKERRAYHLHSNIFGAKQRALDSGESVKEDLISFPRPRLTTARTA